MPHTSATSNRDMLPKVVIVGGGFGGLAVAQGLHDAAADVLLVDQRNHHLFQPMLYQVAMGQVMPGDISEPLRKLFAGDVTVRPRMDAVEAIDMDAQRVDFVNGQSAHYDKLVLATGARFQYLGHPEWQPHVFALQNLEQAMGMRERVFSALEQAGQSEDDAARRAHLSFVIVGAGPTGVELAGALGRLLPGVIKNQFPELDRERLRIVLIDPKPRALATMHESLGLYAGQRLQAMGVELMTEIAVDDIGDGWVQLPDDQRIDATTIIWAAGMEGAGAGDWLPNALVGKGNKVPVGADLTVPGHPEVFVIGDAAAATNEDGEPYPGLAAVAKQQGAYVANLIRAQLDETQDQPPPRFHYKDYGTMAIIANGCAVGEIRGRNVDGLSAWLLWGMVHLYSLVSTGTRVLVLASWLWAMLTGRHQRVLLTSAGQRRRDSHADSATASKRP